MSSSSSPPSDHQAEAHDAIAYDHHEDEGDAVTTRRRRMKRS
jgi:hypothetical protein